MTILQPSPHIHIETNLLVMQLVGRPMLKSVSECQMDLPRFTTRRPSYGLKIICWFVWNSNPFSVTSNWLFGSGDLKIVCWFVWNSNPFSDYVELVIWF